MAAIDAQGTTFTADTDVVGGIVSFSGFDGEASDIDVTTLASTAKEYRVGLQDFGNFSLEVIYDPNDVGQAQMATNMAALTETTFVLTLPDDVVLNKATFNGFVKSMSISGGVDDVVKGTVNIRITGAVVWTDSTQ